MLYFLLHDADAFHHRIAPALARSWRQHTFGPIVALARDLGPAITTFTERFHLTVDERPLLAQLTANRPFDRRMWRHLAGEVLLYAAVDAPPVQTATDTLASLVASHQRDAVRQAHVGSRDLDFDGVPYRPGHAGLNDVADVCRLANELTAIEPAGWTAADLADLAADERIDEVAFAQECFTALSGMYQKARDCGQVVVCEDI
jgi:hypothetical protein